MPRRPTYPIVIAAILVLATLIRWPTLSAPFVSDDYSLIAGIERGNGHLAPLMNSRYQLWAFYDGVRPHTAAAVASGALPWWTAPEAKLALLRPLSSVVLTAIHAQAGWQPRPYHVATLAAFLLSIIAAAALFGSVLSPGVAALATLLFSVHSVHAVSSNWISAIHLPMATALSMFACYAHVRWRHDGARTNRRLSIVLFAAALSAGEVALAALPLLVAYELSARPRRAAWIRAVTPAIALAGIYLIVYWALGFGARGIPQYVSPLDAGYWRADRMSALALQLFLQSPPWMTGQLFARQFVAVSAFLAAGPLILFVAHLRAERDRLKPTLIWGAAIALSAVPALGGPSVRGLFLTSIATSAVMALVLASGVRAWRLARHPAWWFALTAGIIGTTMAHLALALFTTAATPQPFRELADTELQKYQAIRPRDPASTAVVLLNADDEASAVWGGVIAQVAGSGDLREWRALSLSQNPMAVRRTATNAFELDSMSAGFEMSAYRDSHRDPFSPGDTVTTNRLRIQVKEVKDGTPAVIAVEFNRPLEDQSLYFVARTARGFQPIAMPPIGGVLRLGAALEPTASGDAGP